MIDAELIQTAKQLRKIPIGRLRRRGLEGTAERSRNPGVVGREIDMDDAAVHDGRILRKFTVWFELHRHCKRATASGSFRGFARETVKNGQ